MLSKFFSHTSIIAIYNGQIVGFISSFFLPGEPETLFVWQVAVDESCRGQGMGKVLLRQLLSREECSGINYIKTTVTPSNIASMSLFEGLARDLKTSFKVEDCFPGELFPDKGHEDEMLYTIGPF